MIICENKMDIVGNIKIKLRIRLYGKLFFKVRNVAVALLWLNTNANRYSQVSESSYKFLSFIKIKAYNKYVIERY